MIIFYLSSLIWASKSWAVTLGNQYFVICRHWRARSDCMDLHAVWSGPSVFAVLLCRVSKVLYTVRKPIRQAVQMDRLVMDFAVHPDTWVFPRDNKFCNHFLVTKFKFSCGNLGNISFRLIMPKILLLKGDWFMISRIESVPHRIH